LTLPAYMLHPWDYPRELLGRCCSLPTPRRPRPCFFFAYEAASVALVFMIGLTYALIFPLILPACALYFAVALVFYRWLFDNVYLHDWDGGGEYWNDLFNSLMLGLFLGVCSFSAIGIFYVRFPLGIIAFGPLLILVLGTHWRSVAKYAKLAHSLAFEDAARIDKRFDRLSDFDPNCYRDPVVGEVADAMELGAFS